MTDFKNDNNNQILKQAVKFLQLRFPVAEIQRATNESKGNISSFLNDKKPVSDAFLKTFSEVFKIDLKEFGYTKGLERIEQKNPQQETNGFNLKEQYETLVNHYIFLVDRLERDLDFERSKNSRK